ncbi:hypothetical protein [Catellatospora methionotrophica]|uniref:hypothetical protein n=1 Tax=Catellatospora methionotrophica TaxID=121620 RepID=UPI0033CC6867
MTDRRLATYKLLLAPALARVDGVTDDSADLGVAEAILMAAESSDGVALTRLEIASRAGFAADDPVFVARFSLLCESGALYRPRRTKKSQQRYFPHPHAILAIELLARLNEDHGAAQLQGLLLTAADRMEAAFQGGDRSRFPSVDEVAVRIRRMSATLHAYANEIDNAVSRGTFAELLRARMGDATNAHMAHINRISRWVNEPGGPYVSLFHDANRLLEAGQRLVEASQRLIDRITVKAVDRDTRGLLGLVRADTYRDVALEASLDQLATVAADVVLPPVGPLVHLQDLVAAAETLGVVPEERVIPEPPAPDDRPDPRIRLLRRREARLADRLAVRQWAVRTLGGQAEADATHDAMNWKETMRTLADTMAASRDRELAVVGVIESVPRVGSHPQVAVRHRLRLAASGGAGAESPHE